MTSQTIDQRPLPSSSSWLKSYYFTRFAFSAVLGSLHSRSPKACRRSPLAAVMLVGYPLWDAIANYVDASRNGGLGRNKSQMLNFIVSVVTAVGPSGGHRAAGSGPCAARPG